MLRDEVLDEARVGRRLAVAPRADVGLALRQVGRRLKLAKIYG